MPQFRTKPLPPRYPLLRRYEKAKIRHTSQIEEDVIGFGKMFENCVSLFRFAIERKILHKYSSNDILAHKIILDRVSIRAKYLTSGAEINQIVKVPVHEDDYAVY